MSKWDPQKQDWVEEYPDHTKGFKTKSERRPWIILLIGIAVIVFAAAFIWAGDHDLIPGIHPAPAPGIGEASVQSGPTNVPDSPGPTGLPVSTLQGLAGAVGRALLVEEDPEKAAFIVTNARVIAAPCQVYVSDGYHERGDLVEAHMRQRLRRVVEHMPGATVGFAHLGRYYIAAVQRCPE